MTRPSDPVILLPVSPFDFPQLPPLELCTELGDVYNQRMDTYHRLLEPAILFGFSPHLSFPDEREGVGSGFSQTRDQRVEEKEFTRIIYALREEAQ